MKHYRNATRDLPSVSLFLLLASGPAGVCIAQPLISDLGPLPGWTTSAARDVSADGQSWWEWMAPTGTQGSPGWRRAR